MRSGRQSKVAWSQTTHLSITVSTNRHRFSCWAGFPPWEIAEIAAALHAPEDPAPKDHLIDVYIPAIQMGAVTPLRKCARAFGSPELSLVRWVIDAWFVHASGTEIGYRWATEAADEQVGRLALG
jgi:hypothetical protein